MTRAASPFRLLPGSVDSPVLLHVPHSSRSIPAPVRGGIVLDDEALERELDHITDAYTAELAAEAVEAPATGEPVTSPRSPRPWRFVNGLSRLVVDPERFPDEREEMRAVGMGAVYTLTTHGERLRGEDVPQQPLIDRYFHPYAEAMTAAVDARLAATGRAVVIDVHSYPTDPLPYELHAAGPRPPICLGVDAFHTPPALVALARSAFSGFGDIGVNSPFAGTYVPLKHYGADPRVSALMIEIRRDLYMREPGGPAGPGLTALGVALSQLASPAGPDLVQTY